MIRHRLAQLIFNVCHLLRSQTFRSLISNHKSFNQPLFSGNHNCSYKEAYKEACKGKASTVSKSKRNKGLDTTFTRSYFPYTDASLQG